MHSDRRKKYGNALGVKKEYVVIIKFRASFFPFTSFKNLC